MQNITHIIKTCLNQKINFDPKVDDTGREWWYISALYGEEQKIPDMPIESLEEEIKKLKLVSIKEISIFKLFNRRVIQIRGNREAIIKECESLK